MQTTPLYKTAAELKIEQWEHDGLVALIGPLSRSELGLNMVEIISCGTSACIGGWVDYFAKRTWGVDSSISRAFHGPRTSLRELYYPKLNAAYAATAAEAAHAIVNFLTLGDPRWGDVMRRPALGRRHAGARVMDTSIRQQVREPNAYIGSRIRAGRLLSGWSQERLAASLGVSFQQVQKYENGGNRVSACSLAAVARLFALEVGYFYPATTEGRS